MKNQRRVLKIPKNTYEQYKQYAIDNNCAEIQEVAGLEEIEIYGEFIEVPEPEDSEIKKMSDKLTNLVARLEAANVITKEA